MDTLGSGGLLLLAAAVLAGSGTQRVTGLGFALVAAPFLVLLIGPLQGVLLANALSLATNLVVLVPTWRDVEVRRGLLLAVPALAAVMPGAWAVRSLPPPVLAVAVGLVVLVALIVVLFSTRSRVFRGRTGAVGAGAMSGFMNVTAGVGGPALTLYAVSTRWEHRAFVATAQFYFALVNAGSLAAKGWPDLSTGTWVVAAAALVCGVLAGQRLAVLVPPEQARRLVLALAFLGSSAAVVQGLLAL